MALFGPKTPVQYQAPVALQYHSSTRLQHHFSTSSSATTTSWREAPVLGYMPVPIPGSSTTSVPLQYHSSTNPVLVPPPPPHLTVKYLYQAPCIWLLQRCPVHLLPGNLLQVCVLYVCQVIEAQLTHYLATYSRCLSPRPAINILNNHIIM